MYTTKSHPMNERETITAFTKKLPSLLPNMNIGDISLEVPIDDRNRADVMVQVRTGNLKKYLLIEVKSSGEPRIVQGSIYQLKNLVGSNKGTYPVFVAPYISERSREILASENIGYIDLIGDVYLKFDSVLVDRISNAEKETERHLSRSIFANKATRVIRAILNAPNKGWKITELANMCKMSPAGVYFVINQLEDKAYISREKDKSIKLVDSKRLLKDWASNWTVEKSRSIGFFSFAKNPEEIISKVVKAGDELNLKYAFTGMAGASMVSPFVRYNDVWVYVSGDIDDIVKKLDLRPTTFGANIRIFEPYDEGIFMDSREIRGVKVVSDIQLYIDLFTYPARGQEQAEKILEKNIKVVGPY
ncbi:MAG: type IV toxin-antitoxin system AbiEi family antitoxin [Candidatus Thermoplasmatota archaeon]|nr:type IV toxin-antitoxin system AbiEi family antitoxin [Candidatus Thermoplasmatota archaeon]